ncbi:hypothetical protein PV08_04042 [Exophiala spinifera]|uniref:Cytochrome P450 monooxygenase n=1 Tax=Exophiala spinifera TaxID=91928 RepID=A0A0D1ZVX5_9EURO|nr:uncharacterized protein PV08_04042 [Exophiala spinifera]KIW16852.1 hypothetical protein PV08_04042 [Exophiala spinifera]
MHLSLFICLLFGEANAATLDFIRPRDDSASWRLYVLGLIGVCSLAWGIYRMWIYPFFISPLRHLPEPKGAHPFIGHMVARLSQPPGEQQARWVKEVPNDGLIRVRGFLNSEALCITTPQAIAEVLVTKNYDFIKPQRAAQFLARILGDGLVVVEGDVHKFQRKHIQPSFSFRHIKELYPIFWQKSVEVADRIKTDLINGRSSGILGVSDLAFWAPKVTLDIIGAAAMGHDFHTINDNDEELVHLYERILTPSRELQLFFVLNLIGLKWLLRFMPWVDTDSWLTQQTDKLRTLCRQFVAEKKRSMKVDGEGSADLLSKLIESNNFSDEELADQLLTFLAAGHETTSSTLEWAAYLLARHPEIQTQLREEIRANIPRDFVIDTQAFDLAGTLESMPILNGVCNETFRLYSTVPQTLRVAVRPTTILGYPLKKGTMIILSPHGINRSPQLWGPDAEEFKPSRWIDKGTGKPNNSGGAQSNYSMMTFLHGPRSCIGQGFAKAELRALLAVLTGTFNMELKDPNYRPLRAGAVTTKPSEGMPLKLTTI